MTTYVPLPGSKRALLPNSRPLGAIDPSEIGSLTVRLRSRGKTAALEKLVLDQSRQPLKSRVYLTHDQLSEQYGAAKDDLDKVEQVAQQHDLFVLLRSAAKRSVVVQGKLGDLLAAFPADIQMYDHPTGQYRGRRGEISVPKDLQGIVTGVFGFDTRKKKRRSLRRVIAAQGGPGGTQGLVSTDFAKRYNFPEAFEGVTLDGTGQTIAIIELGGGFRGSDLKTFFHEIGGKAPSVVSISVDQASNDPTTADSADGEVMLDIEVAGAVVPKAKLAIYFAPNNGDQGFLDAISAAVHDTERKPSVISISWGGPENTSDQQGMDAFHEVFVEAAAVGITVCAASGDHGSALLDAQDWDGKIHVDHPAADSLVLGCGGTQVDGGQDVVWNDGSKFDVNVAGGGGWATGGGVSEIFPVPDYQQDAKVPVSIATKKPGRGVPDIAMSATNYFTRVDGFEGASGGTSAVAPLMAALVARLNQAKQKNVGFINPFLYSTPGVTKDVTVGSNAIGDIPGYRAGQGWDACTGLGTPDGATILNKL